MYTQYMYVKRTIPKNTTVSHTAYMLKVHMISLAPGPSSSGNKIAGTAFRKGLGSQVHSSVMFVDTNINLRKVLGIW